MSIDSKDVWNDTLQKAKTKLKKNDEDYVTNKGEIVKKLAKDLEDQGMPLEQIANSIVHELRDANISKAYILEVIDKKYKRHYNKSKEPEQLSEIPTTIEDKKLIEVSATTSGNTVSEPEVRPPPTNNNSQTEQQQEKPNMFPKGAAVPEVIEKVKSIENENKTLKEEIKVLKQDFDNAIKVKNEVLQKARSANNDSNDEIMKKAFTEIFGFDYEPNQLERNERKFNNTIILTLYGANWVINNLREKIAKQPKSPFYLIQQDHKEISEGLGHLTVNHKKMDFLT